MSLRIGKHISEQLGLNYVFFCEFEEMHSPLRSPELQVCDTMHNAMPFGSHLQTNNTSRAMVHPKTKFHKKMWLAGWRCARQCLAEQI